MQNALGLIVRGESLPLRGVLQDLRIYPFTWMFLCALQIAWQSLSVQVQVLLHVSCHFLMIAVQF